MKLLMCPKGYIMTRVGTLDIAIDRAPSEDRGYTLVSSHIAAQLLSRTGYEEVSIESYPRNLDELKKLVGKRVLSVGVMSGEPAENPQLDIEKTKKAYQPSQKLNKRLWWQFWKR